MPSRFTTPAAALIAAATLAAPAAAQTGACLTTAEARSVVAYALPTAIDATAARCRTVLPTSPWLNRGAAALSARYRRDGGGNPDAALAVVQRMSGRSVPAMLDPATLVTVVDQLIADRIGTAVSPRDCPAISQIAEQISPLPIGNVAALVVALVQLDRNAASRTGLRLCPAGAR